MSEETKRENCSIGILAQYSGPDSLLAAASQVRSKGYRDVEAYSPFPIHGMDQALGIRPSVLPWLVLAAGVFGGVAALGGQWWTNAVDYPYIISGKPMFSLPANIPVTFEVIILSAATVAFLGMLALNQLPRFSQPLLRNARFSKASDDGFFLLVSDSTAEDDQVRMVLEDSGALHVELVSEPVAESRIPQPLIYASAILLCLALLPPLVIASARGTTSTKPRLHTFFDMDFQPKLKAQGTFDIFPDGRAMRPQVEGTVSRGGLDKPADSGFIAETEPGSQDIKEIQQWRDEFPIEVTESLVERGRERFNIHCAVCHGKAGYGNGLASIRALELQQGTWVPPTSLHAEYVQAQPVGQLFNSITNGIRKMPAYGHQISSEDRWAIVLYVKALQRSQNATLADVPMDLRSTLRASE